MFIMGSRYFYRDDFSQKLCEPTLWTLLQVPRCFLCDCESKRRLPRPALRFGSRTWGSYHYHRTIEGSGRMHTNTDTVY